MNARKPLTILAATAALAGAAGGATALAQSSERVDGDADVTGTRLELEATTPLATTRVTFLYAGKQLKGRLVETDRDDREKEWEVTTRALRSDQRPGATIDFRVRACDRGGCTTTSVRERD